MSGDHSNYVSSDAAQYGIQDRNFRIPKFSGLGDLSELYHRLCEYVSNLSDSVSEKKDALCSWLPERMGVAPPTSHI